MNKHNQDGAVSGLGVSLVLAIVLLLASIGFGYWAFSSRQDYKDHSDAKVDAAVKTAVAQESSLKDQQFAEEVKNPVATYNGPEASGSLKIRYPKTWSVYVDDDGSGPQPTLDVYFNPSFVPPIGAQSATFAMRVQVIGRSYSDVVQGYTGPQAGKVTVSAYTLPRLPKVVGVKVVGAITRQTEGTMVILPLRSQTIEIETDGTQFVNDFNKYVLPNFEFSP